LRVSTQSGFGLFESSIEHTTLVKDLSPPVESSLPALFNHLKSTVMEKTKSHLLFSGFKFAISLLLLCSLLWVCSSGDRRKGDPEVPSVNQLKLNCVILTKSQIQHWVDRGWTNPADPIKKILLQFASTDAANADSLRIAALPAKSYLSVYVEGREFAAVDTICKQLIPADTAYFANTYIHINKLKILDSAGYLKDFSFIRLIPVTNRAKYGNYIVFNIEVVKVIDKKETILAAYTSDPCPHYCPDDTEIESED
jgi:hypothetical protein